MKRPLGTTGRAIAPIGLGCMGMSWGYSESQRDDARSIEVIHQALDAGVELIDTAAVYGDGHNEQLVGRALRGRRNEALVATKGGLVVDDLVTKQMHRDGRPETLATQINESLRRLNVDHIDLYYLHRVDEMVPIEESWSALAAAVEAGKVRWLGLSEVTIPQAMVAHKVHPVTAIQSELSLWTRDPLGGTTAATTGGAGSGTTPEGNLLAWTQSHGISFVPFAPLGRGYLTGTLTPGSFESSDFRATNPRFTDEAFAQNHMITDSLARIADDHGATPSQIALAWLCSLSDNIIPIPGTRSGDHLRENLQATDLVLTDVEKRILAQLPAPEGTRY